MSVAINLMLNESVLIVLFPRRQMILFSKLFVAFHYYKCTLCCKHAYYIQISIIDNFICRCRRIILRVKAPLFLFIYMCVVYMAMFSMVVVIEKGAHRC